MCSGHQGQTVLLIEHFGNIVPEGITSSSEVVTMYMHMRYRKMIHAEIKEVYVNNLVSY